MTNFTDTYWLEQLDEQCREHNREVDGLHKRIDDLEQLVRNMRNVLWKCYRRPFVSRFPEDCRDCEHFANWCMANADFDKRMKELGINTNGGD